MSSGDDEDNEEAPLFAENSSIESVQNPSSLLLQQQPPPKSSSATRQTSWGIHKHNYDFLNDLSNEKNMRSNVSDILSRINPNPIFHSTHKNKLSGSDSEEIDEDLIDFQKLETRKHRLLYEMRIKSMVANGRSNLRQKKEEQRFHRKLEEIEQAQMRLNKQVFCCFKRRKQFKITKWQDIERRMKQNGSDSCNSSKNQYSPGSSPHGRRRHE